MWGLAEVAASCPASLPVLFSNEKLALLISGKLSIAECTRRKLRWNVRFPHFVREVAQLSDDGFRNPRYREHPYTSPQNKHLLVEPRRYDSISADSITARCFSKRGIPNGLCTTPLDSNVASVSSNELFAQLQVYTVDTSHI